MVYRVIFLFFLPVLLSLIGPGSNNSHHPENSYDVNNSSCSSPSKNDDQQSVSPRLELNTDLWSKSNMIIKNS